MNLKVFLISYSLVLGATLLVSFLLPPAILLSPEPIDVELADLASGISTFEGRVVRTRGRVRYLFSFYMYEDFWLTTNEPTYDAIPVKLGFAGLTRPSENASIEITGEILHSQLEGGFYFLKAISMNPAS